MDLSRNGEVSALGTSIWFDETDVLYAISTINHYMHSERKIHDDKSHLNRIDLSGLPQLEYGQPVELSVNQAGTVVRIYERVIDSQRSASKTFASIPGNRNAARLGTRNSDGVPPPDYASLKAKIDARILELTQQKDDINKYIAGAVLNGMKENREAK